MRYLITEDWPIWGPNPRYAICTVDAAEVDFSDLFQALSSKCIKKRSAILLRLFAVSFVLVYLLIFIGRLDPEISCDWKKYICIILLDTQPRSI